MENYHVFRGKSSRGVASIAMLNDQRLCDACSLQTGETIENIPQIPPQNSTCIIHIIYIYIVCVCAKHGINLYTNK